MTSDKKAPEFDFTTLAGFQATHAFVQENWPTRFAKYFALLFGGPPMLNILFPGLFMPLRVAPTRDKQAQAAKEIIETARKNGVKTMKVKVDRKVGAGLKGDIQGANVEAHIGTDNAMELTIEFFAPSDGRMA